MSSINHLSDRVVEYLNHSRAWQCSTTTMASHMDVGFVTIREKNVVKHVKVFRVLCGMK